MKERAGITESRTLDGWAVKVAADPGALMFWKATPTGLRQQPAVMRIDEAGMAHTRLSGALIERAIAANVKVVAIGDSGQLSSVQAGGWLGALTRRLGSQELRAVMRQRDPLERRALAAVHRGEPGSYLELKCRRGELHVFRGVEPGRDAADALVARWTAACQSHGVDGAVMVCRDNARRERLNELARVRLHEAHVLGESVEIGGSAWAVGDRVIARRNDRSRDLDNGTRGTITTVSERDGLTVQVDSGELRRFEHEYVKCRVEHAYALTGHGMQGATVQWAGVIGHPRDFSRNWSYTALSRAREPVEIFLVDELTNVEQERAEVAPVQQTESRDPLERMGRRMRERDEDLALEQLEHGAHRADEFERRDGAAYAVGDSPAAETTGTPNSPVMARLYEQEERLRVIREELQSQAIEDAKAVPRIRETIVEIEREDERDRRPGGRRDRAGHALRQRQRQRRVSELREQETRLLDRTQCPDVVLERAETLREEQRRLSAEQQALREQAIEAELASRPVWLDQAIGSKPEDGHLRDRWERTARELAGHRIDHRVTDTTVGFGEQLPDMALRRALTDTRAAFGLGVDRQESSFDLAR